MIPAAILIVGLLIVIGIFVLRIETKFSTLDDEQVEQAKRLEAYDRRIVNLETKPFSNEKIMERLAELEKRFPK